MLVASWFICAILCFWTYCLVFKKYFSIKTCKLNIKFIFYSILIGIIYCFVMNVPFLTYLRPYIIQTVLFIGLLITFRMSFLNTLIMSLSLFIMLSISEIIYGFIIIFLFKINAQDFVSQWYGYLLTNLMIYLFTYFIASNKVISNFLKNILIYSKLNRKRNLLFLSLLSMIVVTYFLYNNFIEVLPRQILWLTNIFSIIVIFFIVSYFKEKVYNKKIVDEYDQILKYVKKYEKVIEDKSKTQHEYKNQLIILRGMISKSNKTALKYIDELNDELKENEDIELLNKLKHLPNGGLKGLIYYKIEEMYEKNINVFIDISSEVENINMDNLVNRELKDISRVIGVYIDNAIEACYDSKEKYVVLEFYTENDNWIFSLSNTYSNSFDISKIDNEGYTTKGVGKGYGLSLVRDILSRNKYLQSQKELNGMYYVQKLYIKNRVK